MMPYEWLFCESSIYADGITLLGPTRSSILSMLNVCDIYARNMDIVFNQAKTHCIFPPSTSQFTSSQDSSDRNIPQSIQKVVS